MADREITDMFKLIIDNMATKDDLKELEARMEARMASKDDLKREIRETESRLNTRIDSLDARINGLESRFDVLESKVDGMQASIVSKMITQDDLLMIANRSATMA